LIGAELPQPLVGMTTTQSKYKDKVKKKLSVNTDTAAFKTRCHQDWKPEDHEKYY
jgi:hypothetical protein